MLASVIRCTSESAASPLSKTTKMWTLLSLAFLLVSATADETPSTAASITPVNTTDVNVQDGEPTLQKCFHLPVEDCPNTSSLVGGSKCSNRSGAVICCHLVNAAFDVKEQLGRIGGSGPPMSLHIHNATFKNLDASMFELSNRIVNLTISDSQVSRIVGRFPGSITCLNLSGNSLTSIDNDTFSSLTNLTSLDISGNNLTTLPDLTRITANPFWLDISGSNEFQCHSIQDMRKQMINLSFSHDKDTFCNVNQSYTWFTNTVRVSLKQLEELSMLDKNCPQKESSYKCTCKAQRLQVVPKLKFSVSVDCSGQQLTELPQELPPNTVSLNVSNNNITSLGTVADNPSYAEIRELHADHNKISSMMDLESIKFIDDFDVLSLRNNKIKEIQIYILANAFSKASSQSIVKLGYNYLKCDCNTAKEIKTWLSANKKHIQDCDDIYCEDRTSKVIDLVDNLVCVGGLEFKMADYIYFVIAGEIALLLLLVMKVSYDYWVFKTAGYLPWPASKMPKLPCDWCFEK